MKKINLLIIIFIGLLCITTKCEKEDCHNTITFINSSDKTLYTIAPRPPSDIFSNVGSYLTAVNSRYKVLPNSVNTECLSMRPKNCYDAWPEVKIFIFDEQILTTIPWDTVVKHYMIVQRYDLTLDNLRELNWEIPYPPTDAMKNMKMYPPYGE